MPPLSAMFKTVSTDCNLDCSYCYYRESAEGSRLRRRTDLSLLEALIPQYMEYVADAHRASLNWQGGEPTLAGLDFFQRVMELEAHAARPPTTISNALQTNATLLDDAWGRFLGTYNFLVGVSLDGPEAIHDLARRDRGGRGSFRRVMAGIDVLRRHQVELNILCVVGPHNVARASELMEFFRREGFRYLQFMPAMAFQSTEPARPPSYLVPPEDYGAFLAELFDQWYGDGLPTVSIRTFDNFLQSSLGIPNDLCIHGDSCNAGVVIEHNGDVYPCDFYVHPEWRLGNVLQAPLWRMVESPAMRAFIARKHPLPPACQACQWQALCKGGCVRNRFILGDGSVAPSYFCSSYQRLFGHAAGRLARLGQRVASYQRYLQATATGSLPVPARQGACPCGSGKTFQTCCGEPAIGRSYLFQTG